MNARVYLFIHFNKLRLLLISRDSLDENEVDVARINREKTGGDQVITRVHRKSCWTIER
jgi:hypothetical protein